MTFFSAILTGLGLSHRESAAFFNVRLDTVRSWSAGRNPVPAGVWAQAHALAVQQERAAREVLAAWQEAGESDEIVLGLASDDYDAQSLGWPCRGAQMAAFRRLWEKLPPQVRLKVIPRGSDLSTAAAIEAHESLKAKSAPAGEG
ncbi:MAG: hypothetical protein H3C28_15290 [Sphingomonadales bacterium]|nr:hypothetical protein [Sphingomonadales bacterium]